jgi:tetratricopeptide (TPR) repeat protein
VAFVRAAELADAGRKDEALAIMRAAAQADKTGPEGRVALARFLERIGHPDAPAAWSSLGKDFPQDLNVQRACLQSAAAASDRTFIEDTIRRYSALLGAEPGPADAIAFTARARALMHGQPSRAERDTAVALLGQVVTAQPRAVEPKVALASAWAYSDPSKSIEADHPRAVALLADAQTIEPKNPVIGLELARLCQIQRDFGRARDALTRIAADRECPTAARIVAAGMLLNQGDTSGATALAEIADAQGDKTPATVLTLLAQAYQRQSKDDKAAQIYARLADGAANDEQSILATARYYANHNDAKRAEAVLDRLDPQKFGPAARDHALANLAAERGETAAATARFEAAVKADPARTPIWADYISFLLRGEQKKEAVEVADRALKARPGDAELLRLQTQATLLAGAAEGNELKALIAALSSDPAQAEIVKALRQLDADIASGKADTAAGIMGLADRFPGISLIQSYLARRLASIDSAKATILVDRAMASAPADPVPAKAASEIYLALGDHERMFAAAQQWRSRDLTRPLEADLAVAEAALYLGRFKDGLDVLAPRIDPAIAAPDAPLSTGVINIYCALLSGAGRDNDARALLSPMLASSPKARAVAMAVMIDRANTLDEVRKWLALVEPSIPPDSAEEQVNLALGYQKLVRRFPKDSGDLARQSVTILERLTQNPTTATAAAWEALAVTRHASGPQAGPDAYKEAQVAYRKALELNPDLPISLNNLAFLLYESGQLDEALALATRAIEKRPNSDYLDTFAQVQAAIGKRQADEGKTDLAAESFKSAAAAQRRRAPLMPGETQPLMQAAQLYEQAHDTENAVGCYEKLLGYPTLRQPIQIAAVKNNLAMALIRLNRDTDRAVTLATEATALADDPGLFDTLGWCQIAAGTPAKAAATFRQALKKAEAKKEALVSSSIGLATALAKGTPEEIVEARHALDSVDPAKLSDPEDKRRYDAARQALPPLR